MDVVTAESSTACVNKQQPCYSKASPKFVEKGLDDDDDEDDDAVCGTPPVQVSRIKLKLSRAPSKPAEKTKGAAVDRADVKPVSASTDDYGTASSSSSSKPVCQELQVLSAVRQTRHLG